MRLNFVLPDIYICAYMFIIVTPVKGKVTPADADKKYRYAVPCVLLAARCALCSLVLGLLGQEIYM